MARLDFRIPRDRAIIMQNTAVMGGGFIPEYQTVYDKLVELGDTPPAFVAGNQNTMVKALVDGGLWAKRDQIILPSQYSNNGGGALINCINPGTNDATLVNAPVFTSLEGLVTDGLTNFINLNYNPTDDGVNFTLNSGCVSFYDRLNNLDNGIAVGSGSAIAGADRVIININAAGNLNGGIHDATSAPASVTGDSRGLNAISRTASNLTEVSQNGVVLDGDPAAADTLNALDFYAGAFNEAGSPSNFTVRNFAYIANGGGLTEAELLIEYNAVHAYMVSNGKGHA